jgi:muconolactone delta-isomerase
VVAQPCAQVKCHELSGIVQGELIMAKFMNTFTWNQDLNEEFISLIPVEQENVRKLMAQGKLLHLFLADDDSGGWAVHNGESLEEIMVVIEQMPLYKFMTVNIKKLSDT